MRETEDFIRQFTDLMEELTSMPFEEIGDEESREIVSKDFDLMRRLDTTKARIDSGELAPINSDAAANMEALSNLLKNGLAHGAFSEVLEILKGKPLEERAAYLTDIMERYPMLSLVDRFVIKDMEEIYLTDEYIEGILHEFEEYEELPLTERFERVLNEEVDETEFEEAITEYVDVHRDMIEDYNSANRRITPALTGDFEKDMETLFKLESIADTSEETRRALENFRLYIRNRYGNVENLDELISEKREAYILEQARIAGEEEARRILSEHEHSDEEETHEETNSYSINDRFIISDVTGLVIDNQGLSISQKASNIAYATGTYNGTDDPAVQELMNAGIERIINALMPSDAEIQQIVDRRAAGLRIEDDAERTAAIERIRTEVIEEKRNSIRDSYTQGWKLGFESGIAPYVQQGLQARTELQGKVERHEELGEAILPVSFEELKYAREHFELRRDADTGERKLFIKGTDTEVISPKTKAEFAQALVWQTSFGRTGEGMSSIDVAFADDKKVAYEFFVKQSKRDLRTTGEINLDELSTGLEALGFGEQGRALISSPDVLDTFARTHVVGAKERPALSEPEEVHEADTERRR